MPKYLVTVFLLASCMHVLAPTNLAFGQQPIERFTLESGETVEGFVVMDSGKVLFVTLDDGSTRQIEKSTVMHRITLPDESVDTSGGSEDGLADDERLSSDRAVELRKEVVFAPRTMVIELSGEVNEAMTAGLKVTCPPQPDPFPVS